jgi:hypothetical protein
MIDVFRERHVLTRAQLSTHFRAPHAKRAKTEKRENISMSGPNHYLRPAWTNSLHLLSAMAGERKELGDLFNEMEFLLLSIS